MIDTPAIHEDVPLAPFTTFGIGGPARFFMEARTEADVVAAVLWGRERGLPLLVLGGGSNVLVRDGGFAGLVLAMAIPGIAACTDGAGCVDVGAGVAWETFVDYALAAGLAGIECLAGIPGMTGGTPVQNVGAYGQEVAETIVSVRALDLSSPYLRLDDATNPEQAARAFVELPHAACRFRYRESLFNTDEPGRYIVTRVRFQLVPGGTPSLRYADLRRHFPGGTSPALAEVAAAVRAIRRSKGMLLVPGDPDCRSAGSFFKNPIVPMAALDKIAAATGLAVSAIPHWPVAAAPGQIKIPAAWLLEQAGFARGFVLGDAALSSRHTLALINPGHASCAAVERLQDHILDTVQQRFGLRLQREPVLVG